MQLVAFFENRISLYGAGGGSACDGARGLSISSVSQRTRFNVMPSDHPSSSPRAVNSSFKESWTRRRSVLVAVRTEWAVQCSCGNLRNAMNDERMRQLLS